MRRSFIIALSAIIMLLLTACEGLAGEPEIVGRVPTAVPQQPVDLTPPDIEPDLALGATLFAENCMRCHGVSGEGDGEFVLSGQIQGIPNFTDPQQIEGKTPADYYTQVTVGNIEALMPPFSGSLNDAERWAVANYAYSLAGDAADVAATAPDNTETTTDTGDTTETTTDTGDTTETTTDTGDTTEAPVTTPDDEEAAIVTGQLSGQVIQGTIGAELPAGIEVILRVFNRSMDGTTYRQPIDADGGYIFTDLPLADAHAYFISVEYNGGVFNSEIIEGNVETPEMIANVTIYELTDDDSVIKINYALTQVDLSGETLQVWQLVNVTNTSDRLYVRVDDEENSTSLRIPVPQGLRLAAANDFSRFFYDEAENVIYDTHPVMPGSTQSFHLIYTTSFANEIEITQTFPYDFVGPFEAYVDETILKINAPSWTRLGVQTLGSVEYTGSGIITGPVAGSALNYRVQRTGFYLDTALVGYLLLGAGVVLVAAAGLMVFRGGRNTAQPSPAAGHIEELMAAIADLDEQYEQNAISKTAYDQQRAKLKSQLATLMEATVE